jgi:hypothetical protein
MLRALARELRRQREALDGGTTHEDEYSVER